MASFPKIDQLPEKQPEKEFSKKRYSEYGLLWPVESFQDISYKDTWKQKSFKAEELRDTGKWIKIYLDTNTRYVYN